MFYTFRFECLARESTKCFDPVTWRRYKNDGYSTSLCIRPYASSQQWCSRSHTQRSKQSVVRWKDRSHSLVGSGIYRFMQELQPPLILVILLRFIACYSHIVDTHIYECDWVLGWDAEAAIDSAINRHWSANSSRAISYMASSSMFVVVVGSSPELANKNS